MDFRTLSQLWFTESTNGLCYTYANSLRSLLNHINRYLGDLLITEIKPIDIIYMINDLSSNKNPNTGKPMSKKTLKTIVATTSRIFEMAIDNDWAFKNPARNKAKNIPKNARKKEVTAISERDRKLILSIPHKCQIAAMIMMLLGLRANELIALKWIDLDFNTKRAYIRRHAVKISANEYEIQSGTKNGKKRYVTIPDILLEKLREEKITSSSEYVFPKTDGEPHTPSSWKSVWNGYINSLNYSLYIEDHPSVSKYDPKGYPKTLKINPHQLRHTYATLLYLSNTDVLTASKLMGHSSVQITLDIYTHLDEEYKTLDISNFNNYIANDLI